MKYPELRKELLNILADDQSEIKAFSRNYLQLSADEALKQEKLLSQNSRRRSKRALAILEEIRDPTVENIGLDGSQALSVIGLHSHVSVMQKILRAFENSYKKNPASTHSEAIPSLADRLRIIEGKKQLFGTQWLRGTDGKPFLYPVDSFERANGRRLARGMSRIRRPIDLSNQSIEQKPIIAKPSDIRKPTNQEYEEYVMPYIG